MSSRVAEKGGVRSRCRLVGLLAGLTVLAAPAHAHEFRTAYLQIHETGADRYALSWRAPAKLAAEDRVQLVASPGCRLEPGKVTPLEALVVEDYEVDCRESGGAAWIDLQGLPGVSYDALARVVAASGPERHAHLHGRQQRVWLKQSATPEAAHSNLLREGILHVLGGYDHLAYILLLYLFLRGHWTGLLLGVTSFTIAHSASLALSALGILRLPVRPVEAVIALTICYFALALAHQRPAAPAGAAWRWQTVIVFCGLIHGLGFANSLDLLGFDRQNLVWGLATFNLGIEIAQLMLILAAAAVFRVARLLPGNLAMVPAERALATLVGAMGVFWYLQRVFS